LFLYKCVYIFQEVYTREESHDPDEHESEMLERISRQIVNRIDSMEDNILFQHKKLQASDFGGMGRDMGEFSGEGENEDDGCFSGSLSGGNGGPGGGGSGGGRLTLPRLADIQHSQYQDVKGDIENLRSMMSSIYHMMKGSDHGSRVMITGRETSSRSNSPSRSAGGRYNQNRSSSVGSGPHSQPHQSPRRFSEITPPAEISSLLQDIQELVSVDNPDGQNSNTNQPPTFSSPIKSNIPPLNAAYPSATSVQNPYPPVPGVAALPPTSGAAYPPTSGAAYPPTSGAAYPPTSGAAYPPTTVAPSYPPPTANAAYPPSTNATYPPSTNTTYPPDTTQGAYPPLPGQGLQQPLPPSYPDVNSNNNNNQSFYPPLNPMERSSNEEPSRKLRASLSHSFHTPPTVNKQPNKPNFTPPPAAFARDGPTFRDTPLMSNNRRYGQSEDGSASNSTTTLNNMNDNFSDLDNDIGFQNGTPGRGSGRRRRRKKKSSTYDNIPLNYTETM